MLSGLKKIAIAIGQIILLTTLVSLGGYFLVFRNLPTNVKLPPVSDCKLERQPCSAKLPSGAEIEFEISPKNPEPTESLYLTARLKNINPDSVRVAFDGKTMKMGFLEYELEKEVSPNSDVVQYTGNGGLSVCIIGTMEWIVLVKLVEDDNSYEIPFEMETFYNPGVSSSSSGG